jgi:hypothetical protein
MWRPASPLWIVKQLVIEDGLELIEWEEVPVKGAE